jgi:hypothetical protein
MSLPKSLLHAQQIMLSQGRNPYNRSLPPGVPGEDFAKKKTSGKSTSLAMTQPPVIQPPVIQLFQREIQLFQREIQWL